jgi:hypothetical protein
MPLHHTTAVAKLHICYLDYDGCMHDDAVYFHPRRGIYMATPERALFEWMPILEKLLAPYPQVKIVLSTSWVCVRSFTFAKRQLSAALQARVIGATFHSRAMRREVFELMSRGEQILADVARRQPYRWFAIDNDSEGWPPHLRRQLVLTHDRLGVSEVAVQHEIAEILASF